MSCQDCLLRILDIGVVGNYTPVHSLIHVLLSILRSDGGTTTEQKNMSTYNKMFFVQAIGFNFQHQMK